MINSSKIDKICIFVTIFAFIAALLLWIAAIKLNISDNCLGIETTEYVSEVYKTEYVDKIFDDSFVHTINILISDLNWQFMVKNAIDEEYVLCDAEIDGELIKNVALRPKGNSSLASIDAQGSERFSYKLEFDHYTKGCTYYGLDKLSLNNLGQDKTCMKDYFSYHMMQEMGVPGPLSSYVLLQINGEDFGLYLAVEAIEDAFCYRNYGEEYGNLYRPDAFAIGSISPADFKDIPNSGIFDLSGVRPGERVDILGRIINLAFLDVQDQVSVSAMNYVGDNTKDYKIIWNTSVFDINNEDKKRYIAAVRTLNTGDDPGDALDIDAVLSYFAVHNFINNYDGYTSVFVHNFYVHEKDGKLSMVPWDYNLGFGAFSVESAAECFFDGTGYIVEMDFGDGLHSDMSYVNYPIDTPTFVVSNADRPMFGSWIDIPEYREKYHSYCGAFIEDYFESGQFDIEYNRVYRMIEPYIAADLTFYSLDQYEEATDNFYKYCILRSENINAQLDDRIPTTLEGQIAEPEKIADIGDLDLGKTIDFNSLAFGVTSKDIEQIFDAIAGKNDHTVEGFTHGIEDIKNNPALLGGAIQDIISENALIRNAIIKYVMIGLSFMISVLALIISVNSVRRYRRR